MSEAPLHAIGQLLGRNAGIIGGLLYLAVYGGGPLSLDGLRRRRR